MKISSSYFINSSDTNACQLRHLLHVASSEHSRSQIIVSRHVNRSLASPLSNSGSQVRVRIVHQQQLHTFQSSASFVNVSRSNCEHKRCFSVAVLFVWICLALQ